MIMAQYICKMCNYQFIPRSGKVPTKCPYCEGVNTLLDNTPELGLKEIEDI